MNKALKWVLIVVAGLFILGYAGVQYTLYQTKKHSPHDTIVYQQDGYDIRIEYCRPYKKGRDIFGGLVPYGEVWRTGANEATQFITQTDLLIDDKVLPAGTYTLWTIPGPEKWEVFFNKGEYDWGVDWDSNPSRDPSKDVVKTQVKKLRNFKVLEQFTIDIQPNHEITGAPAMLMLGWDFTRADVVLKK